jgi:hypothetical protein
MIRTFIIGLWKSKRNARKVGHGVHFKERYVSSSLNLLKSKEYFYVGAGSLLRIILILNGEGVRERIRNLSENKQWSVRSGGKRLDSLKDYNSV